MWIACQGGSARAIAELIGREEDWVEAEIAKIPKSDDAVDSRIFRDFAPQVYALWNFAKAEQAGMPQTAHYVALRGAFGRWAEEGGASPRSGRFAGAGRERQNPRGGRPGDKIAARRP